MEYKLQILELKKFLWIMLPLVSLSTVGMIILFAIYMKGYYLLILVVPIPILLFRFLQIKLSKTTSFIFKKECLSIQNNLMQYSDIDGYHWDTNITMDALSIKLKNGKITRYTFSKLDKPKENFIRFCKTFDTFMSENSEIRPHLKYSEVHEKEVKILKPMVFIGALLFLGAIVFFLINEIPLTYHFIMMPGLLLLMYTKAYK
ncbi:MAG: hypothetical protein ACI9E3_000438 [Flavobacteriales bacterium]|jgi:hypothetical protein|tara:strand:+ start:123 stop:731 length:609 start_codon:yes stop_codon:yes gene_type:complete